MAVPMGMGKLPMVGGVLLWTKKASEAWKSRRAKKNKRRHVHSVSLAHPSSDELKKNLNAEIPVRVEEEPVLHERKDEAMPERPAEGTYLARLWDGMYGHEESSGETATEKRSALANDVLNKLKEGSSARELLQQVEEGYGSSL